MAPPALSTVFCDSTDVQDLLSVLGVTLRLDDDADGALSAGESAFLTRACSWATERVKFYTSGLYDAAALPSSWLVNEWSTVLATLYVCSRRCNPVPDSIRELAFGPDNQSGVVGDLKEVRAGVAQIPDVGQRNGTGMSWSLVTVDPRYRVRQLRVQRQGSERSVPRTYPQTPDYYGNGIWEM